MKASEKRAEIFELIKVLNDARATLVVEINKQVGLITNALANEAEDLLLASVAEKGKPTIKSGFGQAAVNDTPLEFITMGTSKRKCSICKEPGHRATTCPKANEAYAQRGAPKAKKARKPLSPERKAQLAKTLEKARAARGKKS